MPKKERQIMSEMYNIIEELCLEKGVNITQMCREAGVHRSTVSELKQGRTLTLGPKNLEKLATYFAVPMDYFLGNKKKPTPENGSERDYGDSVLMDAFKRADESTQQAILLLLKLK
jgi:transcriptional regulator with XRE-family HTH domain